MASWDRTLDDFESHLAVQRAAFAAGDLTGIVAFTPPATVEPLPAGLAMRARALLGASRQLEDEVAGALEAVAAELERSESRERADSAPLYFDSRV
jgi:hypothetical protein